MSVSGNSEGEDKQNAPSPLLKMENQRTVVEETPQPVQPTELDSPDNSETYKKRLACSNCRKRRKKCDFKYPCGSCVRLALDCNVNVTDLRKKRYKNNYVEQLEGKLEYLEKRLEELEKAKKVTPSSVANSDTDSTVDRIDGNNNKKEHTKPRNHLSDSQVQTKRKSSRIDDLKTTVIIRDKITIKDVHDTDNSPGTLGTSASSNNYLSSTSATLQTTNNKHPRFPQFNTELRNPHLTDDAAHLYNNYDPATEPAPNVQHDSSHHGSNDISSKASTNLCNDPQILKSLKNFYKWLYPGYFIFLHRESFLYGFFTDYQDDYEHSRYCSTELVYAVAAIGSRLLPELRLKSMEYFQTARLQVLNKIFREEYTAEVTTVQTLMCLAFYELGNGSFSSAWYFSGLAIRIGYDIGFQLDPQAWVVDSGTHPPNKNVSSGNGSFNIASSGSNYSTVGKDDSGSDENENDILTRSEMAIRSRIYWGCYVADHYICLILGRTPSLSVSNSTIPDSDEMPEIAGTEDFRFDSKLILQVSIPLKNLIILSRIIQIFTSKLFIEPNISHQQKEEYLKKFNLKVYNWRQSLPDFLKWNKNIIKSIDYSTDPTISYFWYHYYIVLLTFNKPFIGQSEDSQIAVQEVLDDLKMLFSNFQQKMGINSFNKCSLHQLFSCSLAIQILVKLRNLEISRSKKQNSPNPLLKKNMAKLNEQLKFFSEIFQKMSPTYEIAIKITGGTLTKNNKGNTYLIRVPPVPSADVTSDNNYSTDFTHVESEDLSSKSRLLPLSPVNINEVAYQTDQAPFMPLSQLQATVSSVSKPSVQQQQQQQPPIASSIVIGMNVNNQYTNNVTDLNNIISYHALNRGSVTSTATTTIPTGINTLSTGTLFKNTNNTQKNNHVADINMESLEEPGYNNSEDNKHDKMISINDIDTHTNKANRMKKNPTENFNTNKMPPLGSWIIPASSTSSGASPPLPSLHPLNNNHSSIPPGIPSGIIPTANPHSHGNMIKSTDTNHINNNNIEYTYDFSLSDEIDDIIRQTFDIDNFNNHHNL